MTKVVTYGPTSTAVAGVPSVTFPVAPVNFDADFVAIDSSKPGQVIYTDVTCPLDQESTLRITQTARPNVYAGTSVETGSMLPSKRGLDTVIELKELHKITDSDDPSFVQYAPYRVAIITNTPISEYVSATVVLHLLERAIAAFGQQGDATLNDGITALLHGAVAKV